MKAVSLIVICALAMCLAITVSSIEVINEEDAEPIFSFWGNLTFPGQARIEGLEFRDDLLPLPEDQARTCCVVQPGQPLTLIRNGAIAGKGRVGPITAATYHRAGDDRMVYFQAEGLPDSIAIAEWPLSAKYRQRSYDLYVIGDLPIRVIEPKRTVWDKSRSEELYIILQEVLDQRIACPVEFERRFVKTDERMRLSLTPSREVVGWMLEELDIYTIEICTGASRKIEVLVCDDSDVPNGPCFVRLDTDHGTGYRYLRGELDHILDINGKTYLVMRSNVPETGAWSYRVYLILPDGTPEVVHSDSSWST